jgi:hypothetical protein
VRVLAVLGIVLALTTGGGAGAAPATTTSSTTPPTTGPSTAPTTTTPAPPPVVILPPPPPFPMGVDSGRFLKVHLLDALAARDVADADIATASTLVTVGSDHVKITSRKLVHAHEHAREVARQLVTIHEQVKAMAVDAYMMGSSVQISGALSSFASAKDVVGLSRNLQLVRSSHDRLLDLVDIERREQARAKREVHAASKARALAENEFRAASRNLAAAQQRKVNALAAVDQAERDYIRFFDLATTSASPIMGPSKLTADDLVAYIDSLHLEPHLTVPLRTLAGFYISEGEAEGIRGDVAFAQSILETGAFMFPGHGLLIPEDNNFAGINACDSCKHGDRYATALQGVRAQMQLLRIYADPTLEKLEDFANPLALLHDIRLGFSGHSKTWFSLGGRWATGPNYGFHIYDIYMQMVRLSERT